MTSAVPTDRPHNHAIFKKIITAAKALKPPRTAVIYPLSGVALKGTADAAAAGLIKPILIGPAKKMRDLAAKNECDIDHYRIIDVTDEQHAAAKGVELCHSSEVDVLMKGSLHTELFMHAVMRDISGLRTHRRISHVFILDVPAYPKMLLISDAAINIYPKLIDKVDIVQNAIDLAHILGVDTPKVAILSAVETVTPAIASTIDAAAICKMADRNQITGALIDGPLAFDNAVNLKAAEIKHIQSPVAGQADILIVPDLESGNMLAKQLEYLAGSEAAGIVLGAKVPIVLTSRADSPKSRLASCAVACLVAEARRKSQNGNTR